MLQFGADAPGSVLENTTNVAKYADYEALKNASHDFASFDTAIWNLEAGYPYFGKEMPTPEPEPTPDKTDVVLNKYANLGINPPIAAVTALLAPPKVPLLIACKVPKLPAVIPGGTYVSPGDT